MARDDGFRVDEPDGPRWTTALEMLAAGEHVVCMGLGLTLAAETPPSPKQPGSVLKVRLQTRHPAERITHDQAAAEIENAQLGVAEIAERSTAFADLISCRQILYELLDDYGMGAVRLAFRDGTGFHFQGLEPSPPR